VTYFFEDEQLKDRYFDLKDIFDIINYGRQSKLKITTPEYGIPGLFPDKKVHAQHLILRRIACRQEHSLSNIYPRLDTVKMGDQRARLLRRTSWWFWISLAANNWKRPVYFVLNGGQDTYISLDQCALCGRVLNCRVLARQSQGH
jgi:hypothetical protein